MAIMSGISALASGVIGAGASISAGNSQARAAKTVARNQLAAGQEAAHRLDPYAAEGQVGLHALNDNMNYLTTPYAPTMDQLQATPGYQFTLQQGLQSTQNAAAARGLGISGAAMKGAADYATGLANNTYATNAGIYQKNQDQIGNLLTGIVNGGAVAANNQGQLITGQVNAAGQTTLAGAQAKAAGTVGAANSFTGGLTSGFNNLYQGQLVKNVMGQNMSASDREAQLAIVSNLPRFK